VPSLWLYAENDSYWARELAAGLASRVFETRQSHALRDDATRCPGADGHLLLVRGSRLWTEHVDRFLDELRF
jgi:hypothetical protein